MKRQTINWLSQPTVGPLVGYDRFFPLRTFGRCDHTGYSNIQLCYSLAFYYYTAELHIAIRQFPALFGSNNRDRRSKRTFLDPRRARTAAFFDLFSSKLDVSILRLVVRSLTNKTPLCPWPANGKVMRLPIIGQQEHL